MNPKIVRFVLLYSSVVLSIGMCWNSCEADQASSSSAEKQEYVLKPKFVENMTTNYTLSADTTYAVGKHSIPESTKANVNLTVKGIDPTSGNAKVDLSVVPTSRVVDGKSVEVDKKMSADIDTSLDIVYDPSGHIVSIKPVNIGKNHISGATLIRLEVQMPDHPVGIGDSWQGSEPTSLGNPPMDIVYTLASVESGVAHISTKMTSNFNTGTVENPMHVQDIEISGNGDSFFDIARGQLSSSAGEMIAILHVRHSDAPGVPANTHTITMSTRATLSLVE